MKTILFSLLTLSMLHASQELTLSQLQSLKTYSHRASVKNMVEKRKLMLVNISQNEAKKIASKACNDENVNLQLLHENQYLYYQVDSSACTLAINALDGEIMTTEIL